MSSANLKEKLDTLKTQRREGKLSPRDFYKELLSLTLALGQELLDEDIGDEDVKKQIPLILAFLEEQISKMEGRGH